MDRTPHPPQDPEVRGKIDKIASFVAKGGPQAEDRLRSDHAGKPQFSFLNFGGEHSEYYRFALQCEIYNMNNGIPPGARPGNDQREITQSQPEQQPSFDFAAAQSRIDQLNQEIVSSQANLKAHFDAIPMLRDAEFATAIADAETSKTTSYLERVGLNVGGLDDLLEQLHSKCSKDVVSSMKKWIFEYCTTDQLREVILMYLLARVRASSSSESFRLHVLYLIHDWAHYCIKKKQTGIIQVLARYVPQLYAFAADNVKDPQIVQKLDKLIGTWEGSKFFDDTVFKSLRNTAVIIQNYKTQTQAEHQKLCSEINQRLLKTFAGYEKQHNEFATHMTNQITAIEAQVEMERMKAEQAHRKNLPSLMGGARRSRFDCGPAAGDYGGFFNAPSAAAAPPSVWNEDDDVDGAPIDSSSTSLPPDFDESSLIPRAPFYELPAGVMMGQIKIEDLTYKPIEVSKLRMPPALPPTPRLLMAIDAFYGPPNPDRPKDTQGWEKDGLAEFYERKSRLRKVLEDTHCINGKTFEDLISNRLSAAELEDEREEREEERRKRIDRYLRGSRSRSRDGSRSRSRSRSITPRKRKNSSSSSRRSSSRSLSPDTRPQFNRRSPSPPPARFAIPTGPPAPLGADNKGAQLMAKMGWSGKGLGAKEHGMQDPVSGGEVRAGDEKFKGLGFKEEKDEFTDFRKRTASQYSERWLNRLV
ncbi:tag-65 [Pristionchus pacificus]|uniref:Tag-65 n=1 Tax=Pristionchus pacificus TaxID=54126 RepID=A0A2A6D389_PRIPA|nr:tag-65 [Pristionchus pacificus]|eukprot:PDM84869.1 tag-65 [Pristionchus pacificus]